jgi:WD40 repeat protein
VGWGCEVGHNARVVSNTCIFVFVRAHVCRTEVKATELFRRDGGGHGFSRILWHPTLPLLAAASSGDKAKVSIWKSFSEGVEPTCKEMQAEHTGAITGLAWVPGAGSGDGMGIACAAADGKVVMCDSAGAVTASFTPFDGEVVQSVLVAQPKGQQTPLIVTGSAGNACIKMWDATGATCLHSLTFTSKDTKAGMRLVSMPTHTTYPFKTLYATHSRLSMYI